MAVWTIRRLEKRHDRSVFACGQPLLDEWLSGRASLIVAISRGHSSLLDLMT